MPRKFDWGGVVIVAAIIGFAVVPLIGYYIGNAIMMALPFFIGFGVMFGLTLWGAKSDGNSGSLNRVRPYENGAEHNPMGRSLREEHYTRDYFYQWQSGNVTGPGSFTSQYPNMYKENN